MAKYEKQRDAYTSSMQGLTLVITGAVFALYCFTSGFWEKILNLPKSMILLMFLEALLSPALSYWSGRQRFEYRYRILVCVTILQALMNPIASLVLIRINGGTAMMRILGIVGVQVCICVPIIVFQFCKGKEFFSKEYWGYAPEEHLEKRDLFEGKYRGIRPAFGYTACPDHGDKGIAFGLLGVGKALLGGYAAHVALFVQASQRKDRVRQALLRK